MATAHKCHKDHYDRHVHGKAFQPNDLTWLLNTAVPLGHSHKLYGSCTGPYRVLHRLTDYLQDSMLQEEKSHSHCKFLSPKPCPSDMRTPKDNTLPPNNLGFSYNLLIDTSDYDRHVHGKAFQPNDLTWLLNTAVPLGHSHKLYGSCTGPYRVLHRLTDYLQDSMLQEEKSHSHCKFLSPKPCPSDMRTPKDNTLPPNNLGFSYNLLIDTSDIAPAPVRAET